MCDNGTGSVQNVLCFICHIKESVCGNCTKSIGGKGHGDRRGVSWRDQQCQELDRNRGRGRDRGRDRGRGRGRDKSVSEPESEPASEPES